MPLRLDAVGKDDQVVLENLIQLYLHEMCKYEPLPLGENGRFTYPDLENYFHKAGHSPFFIRCKGKLAGFVLVRQLDTLGKDPAYCISDFFLVENYRRLGIGEEIARMVFEQFPGQWQVGVNGANQPARDFFRQVLYRYTANGFKTTATPGFQGPVYTFQSPGPRPKDPAAETASNPTLNHLTNPHNL